MMYPLGSTHMVTQRKSFLNKTSPNLDFKDVFKNIEQKSINVPPKDEVPPKEKKLPTPFQKYVYSNYRDPLSLTKKQLEPFHHNLEHTKGYHN